jgi:DNA-binding NtrC family response regulator
MSSANYHPRIFVIDDEHTIASTLSLILRHKGYDTTSFTDPIDALRAVESGAPDLLISDVVMPRLSGIELAIRIQESSPMCKVLLFSGQAVTSKLLEDARVIGHRFEVIAKPIHPTDLLQRIESELGTDYEANLRMK